MYVFSYNLFAGDDRVFHAPLLQAAPGDLLKVWEDYILVLGEHIARPEKYDRRRTASPSQIEVACASFMSEQTLTELHQFVEHRFTTYKKAVPLRMSDIEDCIKRKKSKLVKKRKIEHLHITCHGTECSRATTPSKGQQLVIFPDIWTMFNLLSGKMVDNKAVIIHSRATKKQLSDAYWKIKSWEITTVFATPSKVFRDRAELTSITLIQQHMRYYKNQQEPRYYIPSVIEKLAESTGAKVCRAGMYVHAKTLETLPPTS